MVDDKLVKRGELILLLKAGESPKEGLKRMNEGKVGRPFTHADSLIWALAVLKVCLKLPYRQLVGFSRTLFSLAGARLSASPTPKSSGG